MSEQNREGQSVELDTLGSTVAPSSPVAQDADSLGPDEKRSKPPQPQNKTEEAPAAGREPRDSKKPEGKVKKNPRHKFNVANLRREKVEPRYPFSTEPIAAFSKPSEAYNTGLVSFETALPGKPGKKEKKSISISPMSIAQLTAFPSHTTGNVRVADRTTAMASVLSMKSGNARVSSASVLAKIFCALAESHLTLPQAEIDEAFQDQEGFNKFWAKLLTGLEGTLNLSAHSMTALFKVFTGMDKQFFYVATGLLFNVESRRSPVMGELDAIRGKLGPTAARSLGGLLVFLYLTTTYPIKQTLENASGLVENGAAATGSLIQGILATRSWSFKTKKLLEAILLVGKSAPLVANIVSTWNTPGMQEALSWLLSFQSDYLKSYQEILGLFSASDAVEGFAKLGSAAGYGLQGACRYFLNGAVLHAMQFAILGANKAADKGAQAFNGWLKEHMAAQQAALDLEAQSAARAPEVMPPTEYQGLEQVTPVASTVSAAPVSAPASAAEVDLEQEAIRTIDEAARQPEPLEPTVEQPASTPTVPQEDDIEAGLVQEEQQAAAETTWTRAPASETGIVSSILAGGMFGSRSRAGSTSAPAAAPAASASETAAPSIRYGSDDAV